MAQLHVAPTRAPWYRHVGKGVAVAASTGAALISIVSALYSNGWLGNAESRQSIGNLGAAWVRLRPNIDTAAAIGDTIHFAATIADKAGSILVGARPIWTTGDSSIATVGLDGGVVARSPGFTTVSVVVGSLVATSRIVVKQKVAGILVSSTAGDTAAVVLEGGTLQLRARAVDARGNTVAQTGAAWHIDDTTVATLDASGMLTGRRAGRSVVSARMESASGYLPIAVITTAAALDIVAGGDQRAPAGRALPQAVVVRATNRRGEPAPGKMVTFRVAGSGKIEPPSLRTDADGRARAAWTLGEDPGRQRLLVSVENLDSTLAIVAESDPVPANTRVSALADSMRAPAGVQLSDSIAIRVTDSTGRALADVPVQWSTLDGGAIEAVAPRTDSLGIARARWTLAGKTGMQRARAQLGSGRGIAPVTITATALAGSAADMIVVDGDRQRGKVGATLAKPLVIRVLDAKGNGVEGVPVVLSLSGGSVDDTVAQADRSGAVRVRWTLGRSAGEHTLAVHVDGIKKLLKATASATPRGAANLSFEDAPGEKTGTATARTKTKRLYALVTDVYGNPVADAPVSFSSKSGTVTPARAVTDGKGRVALRWVPGTKAGEQTLAGVVRGTDVRGKYLLSEPATPRRR